MGYIGAVFLSDTPKKDAQDAVNRLRHLGVKQTVILTGDSAPAAVEAGAAIGINDVRSELLPEDKLAELKRSSAAGSARGKVAFGWRWNQ